MRGERWASPRGAARTPPAPPTPPLTVWGRHGRAALAERAVRVARSVLSRPDTAPQSSMVPESTSTFRPAMWPARPTRAWSIAVAVLLMIRLKWSKLQWARGQLGGRWRRCSGCYGGSVESASVRKRLQRSVRERLQRSLYRRLGGYDGGRASSRRPPGRLEGPRSPGPEALLLRADILPGRPPAATSGGSDGAA